MSRPTRVAALIGATVLAAACRDAVNPPVPERGGPGTPLFSYSANGITLDTVNGSMREKGRLLVKGFNHTNPHHGDAVVATFFWLGSTNIIDSVVDVLTTTPYTRVGNQYHLVEYVTSGGYSMATYVATNVQNFPDPNTDPGEGDILAVGAYLSDSVTDGGITISAWTGVEDNFAVALGAHRSSSGSGSGTTAAQAGPIAVDADALVYSVTMSGLFNGAPPQGYSSIGVGSDDSIRNDQAYAVQASAGTVNPGWTWFFDNQVRPWLATTFALKRAPPPQAIALDQLNGTYNESGRVLMAGFNPINPHVGDAIVATFYWVGSTNIIDSVTDHISAVGYPPVGNPYHLVEYVTAGGISMATYVATNVQNFGDADTANIYVVRANLSDSVTGGLAITAYRGVAPTFAAALGAHRSATGSASGTTAVGAGAINVGAGALAYATTLSNGLVGLEGPPGFTAFGTGSDASIKSDAAYAVQGSAGTVDPQWTWFFNSSPRTWLATVLALKGP
jgi:hypothetical protein